VQGRRRCHGVGTAQPLDLRRREPEPGHRSELASQLPHNVDDAHASKRGKDRSGLDTPIDRRLQRERRGLEIAVLWRRLHRETGVAH
jgi:hypothetical protein